MTAIDAYDIRAPFGQIGNKRRIRGGLFAERDHDAPDAPLVLRAEELGGVGAELSLAAKKSAVGRKAG